MIKKLNDLELNNISGGTDSIGDVVEIIFFIPIVALTLRLGFAIYANSKGAKNLI